MTDLIDRNAALEALEWKWAGKAAIDAIKNLPSAQPEHRWIPCSERLPEMFHDVLISTRWKTVDRAYRSFTCWLHNGMDYTNYENDEILAWMPLPEPWKEDKFALWEDLRING